MGEVDVVSGVRHNETAARAARETSANGPVAADGTRQSSGVANAITPERFPDAVIGLIRESGLEGRLVFGRFAESRSVHKVRGMSLVPKAGEFYRLIFNHRETNVHLDLRQWSGGFRNAGDATRAFRRVKAALDDLPS